jgi:hypothetical protein
MTSVVRQDGDQKAAVELGGYLLRIQYQQGPLAQTLGPPSRENASVPPGAALIINTGPDEFVIAGEGLTVTFLPDSTGPRQVELMSVEDGRFEGGTWVPERRMNGDETNGGNYLIFRGTAPTIQKVWLYRHD